MNNITVLINKVSKHGGISGQFDPVLFMTLSQRVEKWVKLYPKITQKRLLTLTQGILENNPAFATRTEWKEYYKLLGNKAIKAGFCQPLNHRYNPTLKGLRYVWQRI